MRELLNGVKMSYGELWIEKASTASNLDIAYRFTGKERDAETGLYYYGARYLDSKTGRWLSADPALGDYVPGAPVDDEARKRNSSLPGMGGVFNVVNLHLYHYAGNNPVKYIDPDGNQSTPFFSPEEFFSILAERNPAIGLLNIIKEALSGNQSAQNHLSSLANQIIEDAGNMAINTADAALVSSMTFMSENGPTIALACYATGNIEIGLVVDGITIASNVALDVRKFSQTGDKMKLANNLLVDGISFAIPNKTGQVILNNVKFSSRETETIIDFITEVEGMLIDKSLGNLE
jgi:RHS repeat-associated protein